MTGIQQRLVELARERYGKSFPDQCWNLFPLESAITAMKKDGQFDTEAYLVENPDIFTGGVDPVEHYMRQGADEGRLLRSRGTRAKSLSYDDNEKLNTEISQHFEKNASQKSKSLPGMMMPQDRAIYFYYAGRHSQWDMVDAGCLVGCTTQNVLDGSKNSAGLEPQIKVFDQFIPDATTKAWLKRYCGDSAGELANFRPIFEANLAEDESRLEVHEGDFAASSYCQKTPISFLGLDLCKSPALTEAAIQKFYPALIPGQSVVIHQDYIHPWLPHIQITMELLNDYFDPILEGREAGCYVFYCKKTINQEHILNLLGGVDWPLHILLGICGLIEICIYWIELLRRCFIVVQEFSYHWQRQSIYIIWD